MSMHFYAHHEFYQEIYEDVYDHVDIIAESIRSLGKFPVGTLTEFAELSQISEEEEVVTDCPTQLAMLAKSNDVILRIIKIAMTSAKESGAEDVLDLLVNRQRKHKKHGWMINAHLERHQRQI